LMAMQGMGKPGVNIWSTCIGAPLDRNFDFPGYTCGGINLISKTKFGHSPLPRNPISNVVYRSHIPDAILDPPFSWRGEGFNGLSIEEQFTHHTYPEPGSAEIKMIYRYGGSFMGTGVATNKWPRAYQSPKVEFVVNQNIFMEPETKFADIIFPVCTGFERVDISEWGNPDGFHRFSQQSGTNHRLLVYHQKCIEPLYESKSDYKVFADLAQRMGIYETFTEGKTEEDWIRQYVESSPLIKYISFEDFKNKGYFVVPFPEDYKPTPALRWFLEGRPCDNDDLNPKVKTEKNKELGTYSGKIEFVSQSLLKHEPDDEERPLIPRYIPSWEGHESEIAAKYPLQLITPHVRYSFHTQHDGHSIWLSEIPGHRVKKDGYYYRTTRINTEDARARSIRQGDIVKVFNDRGAVLGIACVTDRMMPGAVHCYAASSQYDPLEPGVPGSIDQGGCMNILTPNRMMSKNASGMAWNTCLIELQKWEG
jgi:anaerobic selenocysteine-containing dehydrogenase